MKKTNDMTEAEMLRGEVEMLMAEREKLLRLAGATAKFVEKVNIARLPVSVIPLAEAIASSVNALTEDTLREALLTIKK
jgi:hypothetical protein